MQSTLYRLRWSVGWTYDSYEGNNKFIQNIGEKSSARILKIKQIVSYSSEVLVIIFIGTFHAAAVIYYLCSILWSNASVISPIFW